MDAIDNQISVDSGLESDKDSSLHDSVLNPLSPNESNPLSHPNVISDTTYIDCVRNSVPAVSEQMGSVFLNTYLPGNIHAEHYRPNDTFYVRNQNNLDFACGIKNTVPYYMCYPPPSYSQHVGIQNPYFDQNFNAESSFIPQLRKYSLPSHMVQPRICADSSLTRASSLNDITESDESRPITCSTDESRPIICSDESRPITCSTPAEDANRVPPTMKNYNCYQRVDLPHEVLGKPHLFTTEVCSDK